MADNVIDMFPKEEKKENTHVPKVDLEKVTFYEIDAGDDVGHVLTEEEKKQNDTFLQDYLIPELGRRIKVCECRMPEILEKTSRRAKLMNLDPRQIQGALLLDQEDIDASKFGVIVTSKNGVYDGIACITVECAKCRKIDIYGDAASITTLIAGNLANTYDSSKSSETAEASFDIMDLTDAYFEDIETESHPEE